MFFLLCVPLWAAELQWAQESSGVRSAPVRLPPSGKPGFTLLPPDSTGVLFTNFLAEDRHLTNQIYLNGSGVAAGDVDGDDLVDLCFAGLDGPNKLFRNLGDWKFEDITEKAGVACPNLDATGVVLADLDGDGDLDLVVNSIGGGTHILFNDGKARFTESAKNPGLNARRGGSSLALADFDGDGALDLYIGNYRTVTIRDQPNTKFSFGFVNGKPTVMTINGRPLTEPDLTNRFNFKFRLGERGGTMTHEENGEPDLFLRNDGHGAFTPVPWTDGTFLDEAGQPLTEAPLDWTLSVMFRDLNGDGLPDLYTCSDFRSPDRIWLNDGRGHFRALPALALRHTTLSSMGIDVADLNRDGHDDIFVYDMLSRDHRLRFMQRIDIRPEPLPIGVIDNRPQYSRNMLFLARGDGTYAELAYLAGLEATDWAWTPLFLDVDLDGYEDLLVANGFERDNMNMDSLGRLEAAKAERKLEPLEALRLRKMFPRLDTPNQAYRNLGNLRFAEVGQEWNFAQRGVSQGMIAADLDNDGDLDVVVNNLNGAAFVLRNEAVAPRVAARLRGKAPNTHGIGAKIKVLGGPVPQSQEIMVGGRYQSSDAPMRAFAVEVQGSRSKVQSPPNAGLVIEVTWRSGAKSVVSNAQPNRIYEIDEAAAVTASNLKSEISNLKFFQDVSALLNHTHTEEPFDDFDRQPLLPHKLSQLGPGVSWFDLDGDGWDDLVIAGGKGGQLAAYRNDAKGGFTRLEGEPFAQPVYRDQTTVLGWRKPDGKVTLLAGSANYEDGQAEGSVVRFYDLDRKLVEDLLPGSPSSTGPLAMVDIDGDGQLDLFIGGRAMPGRYAEPASSLVFRGQGGSFVPDEANTKRFAASGLVSSAVFSDLDSDGDPDLVLACEWGLLKIFRNDRGSFTPWDWGLAWSTDSASLNSQPSTLSQLTGWWNGVAASDFDGDGRLDLIASNWGRNTKYEHWRAQLLRLYFGDLDANGTIDVVEAYFSDAMKKVVPSQQFHIVGAAMPIIREKLGTWQAYANASVEEIYGEALKQAGELRAVCLESTVFLNRGDKFEVRELPLEAQFAPAFAVCVGDLDGDGHEDAFLSQNFFAVHIDTSRHDAGRGLWLRGNGRGGFAPVPEQESGVLVYGEQRGAALCDFDADGRVDLAVTQNATQTKLFKNVGAKPGLRVRLLGPAGNPHGIGAVLRLDDGADKFGPARELHAGAGYWSQDSVVPVLSAPFTPKQLQVRWPGGRTTTSELPAGAREITVDPSGAVKERAR